MSEKELIKKELIRTADYDKLEIGLEKMSYHAGYRAGLLFAYTLFQKQEARH